jgi:hypothetical protein
MERLVVSSTQRVASAGRRFRKVLHVHRCWNGVLKRGKPEKVVPTASLLQCRQSERSAASPALHGAIVDHIYVKIRLRL